MHEDNESTVECPPEGGKLVDANTDIASPEDRVGYRRPPKSGRFRPGRSGNPRGRPPGVKSLSDIVRKIVGQKVTVTENGRARRIPRLEAILLRAAGAASKGDAPALRLLLQLTERYSESENPSLGREAMSAEDAAILSRYLRSSSYGSIVKAFDEPPEGGGAMPVEPRDASGSDEDPSKDGAVAQLGGGRAYGR